LVTGEIWGQLRLRVGDWIGILYTVFEVMTA
jgi:hypothetical protein